MDRRAFELGYRLGRVVSAIDKPAIARATRTCETALSQLVVIDRQFVDILESAGPSEREWLESWPEPWVTGPWIFGYSFRRALVEVAEDAERAYAAGSAAVSEMHSMFEESGLYELVDDLASVRPPGYGQEREALPPDVTRLAFSLGVSPEEAQKIIGGPIEPSRALEEVREQGSHSLVARLITVPNPFSRVARALRSRISWQRLKKLWPRRQYWGPALGGAVLVGADVVSCFDVLGATSVSGVAAAVQAAYSIPEGFACIRRGVEALRRGQLRGDDKSVGEHERS